MAAMVIETHCLNADLADAAADAEVATAAELDRAACLRSEVDARHFLARRAATRRLLAARRGVPTDELIIVPGPFGKLRVPGTALNISVSHSGPLILIAIAEGLPIGCDIEQAIPHANLMAIADHYFTRAEIARLRALSPDQRVAAFHDCWTRKEAYLQAIGAGMALPMNSFEFIDAGNGAARLANGGTDWLSVSWVPAPGYRAALVAAGDRWTLDRRDEGRSDQR
jgi:4'-phosphopantetheinyl transferase